MATTTIDAGKRVFTNLSSIKFTPWVISGTGANSEIVGEDEYDLVNIVGDSTSIEQADNEVSAIEHEFSSEPLHEVVTLGSKTFTCECIDFQNEVLKSLFGWTTSTDGTAFAPIEYKNLYCKIELAFAGTDDIIVLPKVKLNSRAVIASMKTDVSRGTITGTCYSAWVKVGDVKGETDMAIIGSNAGEPLSYIVSANEPAS